MLRISWRGVREHPIRFLLSVVAVVLGVAFVTGTLALRTSLADTFGALAGASYTADVYVQLDSDDDSLASQTGTASGGIPYSLAEDISAVSGVASAAPEFLDTGVLVNSDGAATSTNGAPTYFTVLNSGWEGGYSLVDGQLPDAAGEVALEQAAADASGLGVGDATEIVLGDGVHDVTVTGVWAYSEALFGATFVAVSQADGEQLLAPEGTVSSIGIRLDDDVDADEEMQAIAAAMGTDVSARDSEQGGYTVELSDGALASVRTGEDLREQAQQTVDEVFGFVGIFLFVFAAVALFIGGFLIANTFTMSVRQRMREFAVLRAIGASPRQVFASVLFQAVIVGVVGGVLGILGGWGLIALVRGLFSTMGGELTSDAPITIETIVVALSVSVGVSVLSALVPARRAALVPPVAAMREITQADGSLRVRGVIGAVLVAGGVAGVIGAAIGGDGFGPLLGVAAASLLLGVLLVAPVLVPGLLGALRRPLRALNDPVGALAVSNVVRNPRRTANTATALTIGMALVGAATVLASSAQASLSDAITQSARSDYVLSGQLGYIPDGVASAVQDVAGVARVDEIRYGQVSVSGETVTALGAADDAAWTDSVTSPMKDGDLAQAIDNGEIVISASRAEEWDVQFGDTLTIAAVQGDAAGQTLQVGGILSSESILSSDVVLPAEVFAEVVPSAVDTLVTVSVTEGTDPESIRSELNDAVAPFYVVSVLTAEDWTGQLASQVDQILYILYALLGISIVIAILGIVNTLALSVIERVREIGLLRAVGMGQAQLAWTIILESVLIAVFGAVLGLVVGVGIASALPSILASSGLGTLSIPWGDLVGMLVLAALAGVLAALWPAARASRLPVLEAISSGE